ncbi:MAG: insulinase family protein [Eubacteriales bacterium]|nr:insulinase family protein [Eubacteriales bacterium]
MLDFKNIYEKIEEKYIAEVPAQAVVYKHIKTGARILTLKNEDKNKVFMIGFRTTPKNDTGVAHIMEHSVLCGSEKFPLKDPFVELVKGSLNTFLNAMTYPDKTVYPVASCNDKDFMNLMDVYLDAVFNPNAVKEKKIFEQEGWHYELKNHDDELKYNGVVYNEMKGAFSDPEAVLERNIMHTLFPANTYGCESGGAPESIPELSYEEFVDFHDTYYHPSNSYIYLYGDMDMEEKLRWIDERYLCSYDYKEVFSDIEEEIPFSEAKFEKTVYPIGKNDSIDNKTYLSENFVIGSARDKNASVNAIAWQILEFMLLDAAGAPLKEALIKKGIGEDIYGGYCSGILQPYFSIVAKNARSTDQETFISTIQDVLLELSNGGLDREQIKAAINFLEFKYREADYGRTPAGLTMGLTAMESWIYGEDPFKLLCYNEVFDYLKEQIDTGYFEKLISDYLINNNYRAEVIAEPCSGLAEEREKELQHKLNEYKDSLSEEEINGLVEATAELEAYQEEENSEEDLNKIPVLSVSDISREALKLKAVQEGKLIYSDIETHGIAYIKVMFDTKTLNEEELQYAAFLKYILGEFNTEKYDYRKLTSEILLHTGGLDFDIASTPVYNNETGYRGLFTANLRVLREEIDYGMGLVLEILRKTSLDDTDRIGEKLLEAKSRMRMKLDGASHSSAILRASSYFDESARYDDLTSGLSFYDFICAAVEFYKVPVHANRFIKKLKEVYLKLFTASNVIYALSGNADEKAEMLRTMKNFEEKLDEAENEIEKEEAKETEEAGRVALTKNTVKIYPAGKLNEGIKTTSQVNYVARCGDFVKHGLKYTGALQVLRIMLNYDYLWQNLRVKGGAYGCMSGFGKNGRAYLVSYRDPKLRETNETYKAIPEYLEKLELSERELNQYIIGAIAQLDQPVTASVNASREVAIYLSGLRDEDYQQDRDQILDCTNEDLRALSPYVKAMLCDDYICVIGNAGNIEENNELFSSVRELK